MHRAEGEATYVEEDGHAAAHRKRLDENVVEYVVDDEAGIGVVDRTESWKNMKGRSVQF